MSRKAFDDFDAFADEYRQIHDQSLRISGTDSDHFSEQKILEVRKSEIGRPSRILDLGCGDGNSAEFFGKHFPDSEYLGLDVSKKSIEIAEQRDIPNATFCHYSGINVPFEDNSFDIVFAACVLHHVNPDLHADLLKEIKRVLKPGGRLYIFEHNPFNPLTRKVVRSCPFDEDAVLLSAFYTKRLLLKAKLDDISINYTIFFPRFGYFNRILHLEKYLKWLPIGGQYCARSTKSN